MTADEIRQSALSRALNPYGSPANYGLIMHGFIAKGIAEDQIRPRENVFTFQAWKALGRTVRKGEHGIKVFVFIKYKEENKRTDENAEPKTHYRSRPHATTVFHISQTDPIKGQIQSSAV